MSSTNTPNIYIDNGTLETAPTSSIEISKDQSSIILGRNLDTTPQYITISPNAISDGTNSTTLTNISQLSTALASVELPPNSTTLKVDNALLLSDGTNEALLDINSVNGNLDITTTGYVTLNNLPRCSDVPTNASELVNKAYADSIVSTNATTVTLVDTNTNSTYYPMFGIGAGPGITPRVDATTGPLSYNPFSGTLSATNFNGTVNNVDVTNDNTNATYYPVFVSGSANGSKNLRMDSVTAPLNYNPSTGSLQAVNFTGSLTGTASSATTAITSTNATNTAITLDNANGTFYPTFVTATTGNLPQEVNTNLTFNPSTGNLTTTTFTGSLSGNATTATTATDATNASNVNVTTDNSNGTYYIPFAKTSGTGNKALFQDDTTGPLAYNPATSTLTASAFQGNLNGSASNITVTDTNTDAIFYPIFGNTTGVGITARADATNGSFTYNPSSGTLTATTFVGNLNGNATSATTSTSTTDATNATNVNITASSTNATFYPTFVSATTGNLPELVDSDLTYNPSTNTLTATTFSGSLSGNATSATTATTATTATNADNTAVTASATNATFYPTFVSATTGNLPQLVDGDLTYNPSTNTLTATTFTGSLNGNANTATSATSATSATNATNSTNSNITIDSTNATYYPTFVSATTGNLPIDVNTNLTFNPSTGELSATTFSGNFNGSITNATNATNTAINIDTANATFYPTFVSATTGNLPQEVNTNLTFNPSTGNLSATSFTGTFNGSITDATNASNVNVTSDNTNGTYFVPFTKTSGTGNKALFQDDTTGPLVYNPSTGSLSAQTFLGSLSGNASTATIATNATNATNVAVTTTSTTDASFFPTFVSANSGNNAIRADAELTYNPFTNTLNVTSVNGTATNATNVFVVDDNTNATYYPLFVSGSTGGNKPPRMDSTTGPLSYNPSLGNLSATTFTGALSGTATNATNVSVTSDNTSGSYYVPFVKLSGSGNRPMFIDDASGPFIYNPDLRELRVSRLTPDPANTSAQLFMIERCVISRIQNFGFSIANATWSGSANTNYAFYCGNDGQNNFNAPSQTTSLNAVSRINFCIDDVKYMNINGNTGRVGNVGIRNTEPDHPLDVTGNIRSTTSVLTPQVGNPAGNLNIQVNSSGAGGSLSITGGTGILSATAGGSSGQHLAITINGTPYKIALLNN